MIQFSNNTDIKKWKYEKFASICAIHLFRKEGHEQVNHSNKDIDNSKSFMNRESFKTPKELKAYKDKIGRKNQVYNFAITSIINTDEPYDSSRLIEVENRYIEWIKSWFVDHEVLGWTVHNDESNPNIHIQISAYNTKLKKYDANEFLNRKKMIAIRKDEKNFLKSLLDEGLIDSMDVYVDKQIRQFFGNVKLTIEEYKQRIKEVQSKLSDKIKELSTEKRYEAIDNVEKKKLDTKMVIFDREEWEKTSKSINLLNSYRPSSKFKASINQVFKYIDDYIYKLEHNPYYQENIDNQINDCLNDLNDFEKDYIEEIKVEFNKVRQQLNDLKDGKLTNNTNNEEYTDDYGYSR